MLRPIRRIFRVEDDKEKKIRIAVETLLGASVSNLELYELAFLHNSASTPLDGKDLRLSNERLEFLGDSVLGMIVAEHLFKKYPFKDEGFLTDIRSRIVNRESLNEVAKKVGLDALVEYDLVRRGVNARTSMYGDALEAFIGAVYLDKGFAFTRNFIVKRLISSYFDIDKLIETKINFKSLVVEWVQKEGREIRYEITEKGTVRNREFTAELLIDNVTVAVGSGFNKKKAEQAAAEKACEKLALR